MTYSIVKLARQATAALLVSLSFSACGLTALAQEGDGDSPPTLPDTNVTADPQTPTGPTNAPPQPQPQQQPNNFPPQNFEGRSILDGTIFDSGQTEGQGYRADAASTGTIVAVRDVDNPGTVSVITRDTMTDQIALNFTDIVRNAGGLAQGTEDVFFGDGVLIRGIQLGSRDFRKDGFLDSTLVPRDFQNVERVEILKGPASFLYGAGSPAGVVNLVTKTPLDFNFSNFGAVFGSFGQQRYTIDANSRINESGTLLGRVNVAQEDVGSFRDFGFTSRTMVAPSLTWILDENTRVTWSGEFHRDWRRGDQGQPAINGNALALPASRFVGDPTNDFIHYQEFRQSLRITHQLNEDWAFNIGGSSLFYQYPASVTAVGPNYLGAVNPMVPNLPEPFFYRTRSNVTQSASQVHSMIANLGGDFYSARDIRHQAVLGMEYVYSDSQSQLSQNAIGEFPPFDATNPSTGPAFVLPNPPVPPIFSLNAPAFRQQRVGFYLHDIMHLNDYWLLTGGVRFDTLDFTYAREARFFGQSVAQLVNPLADPMIRTEQNFFHLSPRGGLMFRPFGDDSVSTYFNYSQSFQPPGGGIYVNQGDLQPITGQSFEIGMKTLLTENLSFNACGFHIERNNADFNQRSFFLQQIGLQVARGAELNLLGQINDRWSAIANYTYVDSRLYDATLGINGVPARNVPNNNFNIWSRYNFYMDDVQTIGFALGVVYVDRRPGDLNGSGFVLPAYGRMDGGLYYQRGRIYANAYLENLTGTRYAVSSLDSYQVFPGAPFNGRCNIGVTF